MKMLRCHMVSKYGVVMALTFSYLFAPTLSYSADGVFVAGVKPYQRPAGAPVLKKFNQSSQWQAKALKGVDKPYPKHITEFLDDQGGWFSPFIWPGMTGAYDLRGYHKK